jgi:hypothetical protein
MFSIRRPYFSIMTTADKKRTRGATDVFVMTYLALKCVRCLSASGQCVYFGTFCARGVLVEPPVLAPPTFGFGCCF